MRVSTVIGAPGAGKTTEVKNRFLAAIEAGLSPDEILVLSASREAANQLRDELALSAQAATGGSLARTVASFAFGILRARAIKLDEPMPQQDRVGASCRPNTWQFDRRWTHRC